MTILDAKTLSFSLYLMKTQWLLELLVVQVKVRKFNEGNHLEHSFLKQM